MKKVDKFFGLIDEKINGKKNRNLIEIRIIKFKIRCKIWKEDLKFSLETKTKIENQHKKLQIKMKNKFKNGNMKGNPVQLVNSVTLIVVQ